MKLSQILEVMHEEISYIDGITTGLTLLTKHYPHLNYDKWEIDHDDISSDYRNLVTTIKHDQTKYGNEPRSSTVSKIMCHQYGSTKE